MFLLYRIQTQNTTTDLRFLYCQATQLAIDTPVIHCVIVKLHLQYQMKMNFAYLSSIHHDGSARYVRDGGIPDGSLFTEIFTGQRLTVQDGCLPLPVIPAGIQIWRSVLQ